MRRIRARLTHVPVTEQTGTAMSGAMKMGGSTLVWSPRGAEVYQSDAAVVHGSEAAVSPAVDDGQPEPPTKVVEIRKEPEVDVSVL